MGKMRPSGALMIEHRLIERFINVVMEKISAAGTQKPDPVFIDTVVDFFRTYADRTHHGKEEDILFRDLAKVKLSQEHAEIMADLVEEHKQARKNVGMIIELNEKYRKNDMNALKGIIDTLKVLAQFYPVHIRKEDEVFFPAALKYFNSEKIDNMTAEFMDFDRKMIHEKYRKITEHYENKGS